MPELPPAGGFGFGQFGHGQSIGQTGRRAGIYLSRNRASPVHHGGEQARAGWAWAWACMTKPRHREALSAGQTQPLRAKPARRDQSGTVRSGVGVGSRLIGGRIEQLVQFAGIAWLELEEPAAVGVAVDALGAV